MIGKKLIIWYTDNKRSLPWRDVENPYLIWVSEIILQQTRVIQGLDYYRRFVAAFPDIFSLAQADLDDVLKIWQGLGYYSRARNMHQAAGYIVTAYQGKFPDTFNELRAIKGIGEYTASAIASLAFGLPVPVVDGNVNRVIARLFGVVQPIDKPDGRKEIRAYAEKLMDRDAPGTYNQAIMEFGALQCTPQNPDCNDCIFSTSCVAFRNGLVNMLPVKQKAAKPTTRYFHYLYVRMNRRTFIRKRASGDIWTGLYEFPMIETASETPWNELSRTPEWQAYFDRQLPLVKSVSPEIMHRLTHRILKIRFYEIIVSQPIGGNDYIEIQESDIDRYAVPVVIGHYLEKLKTEN